jgi:hypothetical protein
MFNLVILTIILISILSGYFLEKVITAYKLKKTLKRLKDNSTEMPYKYHYKPKEEINDEKNYPFLHYRQYPRNSTTTTRIRKVRRIIKKCNL